MTHILCISDHHRHELGCAASLKMQKFDVTYLSMGSTPSLPLDNTRKELTVTVDKGDIKIPIFFSNAPPISEMIKGYTNSVLDRLTENQRFDVVLATLGASYWVGQRISSEQEIPLIVRLWGYKACKIKTYLSYKDKNGILMFFPSLIHTSLQINMSKATVFLDNQTYLFTKKYYPFLNKKNTFIAYPTYSIIRENIDKELSKILDSNINNSDYLFCILDVKSKSGFKTENFLFRILIGIAIKNPGLKIMIIGTSIQDIRSLYNAIALPDNLVFLGKVYSDLLIEKIYENSKLIIAPILYGATISNRLLEAFYYNKPILTNTTTKLVFPELEHRKDVYFSDDYENYGEIVRKLINDDMLLQQLKIGSKNAFEKWFSSERCGSLMKNVIEKNTE